MKLDNVVWQSQSLCSSLDFIGQKWFYSSSHKHLLKKYKWREWNSKERPKLLHNFLPNLKIIFGHCHQILYWLPSSTEKSEIFCLLDHWSMTGTLLLSHRLKLIIEQTLQIKLMGKWRNYICIRHQVIS